MAYYQVIKGWPAAGALDITYSVKSGVNLTPGLIGMLSTTGVELATYDGTGDNEMPVFVIDYDKTTLAATTNYPTQVTGLTSPCIIECDDGFHNSEAYVANSLLTASSGKFLLRTGSNERVVGQVISYSSTTKILRVLWNPDILHQGAA